MNNKTQSEGIKITDEQVKQLIENLYDSIASSTLLPLGEMLDKIEFGMMAFSIAEPDMGTCYAVDEEGYIFSFDGFKMFVDDETVELNYEFGFRKFTPDENEQVNRFILVNNAVELFGKVGQENNESKIGVEE